MVEFDIQKALATTYSGLGAAFIVLAFLILFTLVVRGISRLRGRLTESPGDARHQATPATISPPEPVPAAVAAVTELQEAGPLIPEERESVNGGNGNGQEDPEDGEPVDDWKIYGRLEAFSSRMVGRRGG